MRKFILFLMLFGLFGCSANQTIEVDITITEPTGARTVDGLLTFTIEGGTEPYRIYVNEVEGSSFQCKAGEYNIQVKDANNNVYQSVVTVTQALNAKAYVNEFVDNYQRYAKIEMQIIGGQKPYIMTINGTTFDKKTTVEAGTHKIVVEDSSGVKEEMEVIVKPLETSSVKDSEGNEYVTVKIGSQWWMAENAKISQTQNGESINFTYFNDQESNAEYGYLYDYENAMKIEIDGWHLPTHEDFKILEQELGMSSSDADKIGTTERGKSTGNYLKARGKSGFNALMNGYYSGKQHGYGGLDEGTAFWTSTLHDSNNAIVRTLMKNHGKVYCYPDPLDWRFYVRLVKD